MKRKLYSRTSAIYLLFSNMSEAEYWKHINVCEFFSFDSFLCRLIGNWKDEEKKPLRKLMKDPRRNNTYNIVLFSNYYGLGTIYGDVLSWRCHYVISFTWSSSHPRFLRNLAIFVRCCCGSYCTVFADDDCFCWHAIELADMMSSTLVCVCLFLILAWRWVGSEPISWIYCNIIYLLSLSRREIHFFANIQFVIICFETNMSDTMI